MSAASTKSVLGGLSQERIVLGLSAALFVLFSIFVSGFLTASNVLSLIQNVAILGLLGLGMAITIIGRGIDLTMVAIIAISVAWSLALFNGGMGAAPALLLGFGFALLIGLINGFLIAYVEIPAIFITLAMGTVVYGFGQFLLVPIDVTYVNESIGWIHQLGSGQTLGVPNSVISFAVLAAIAHFVLRATTFGRYLYAMGDNPPAARVAGVPTRLLGDRGEDHVCGRSLKRETGRRAGMRGAQFSKSRARGLTLISPRCGSCAASGNWGIEQKCQ